MKARYLRGAIVLAAMVLSRAFAAALPTPAELREDLEPYLGAPLPSVVSIAGMAIPKPSPLVVVASFSDEGTPADRDRG